MSQLARGQVARQSGFDKTFVDQIVRVGVHPFIMVRISSDGDDPKQFVHCLTQNEAGSFVNELSQLADFSSSNLFGGSREHFS